MNAKNYTYQLKSCVWEITLACCFSCRYCGSKAGRAREHELTTNECLEIVRQLAELGCERVSLIGGEVFMRQDWQIIAKALTDNGIRVSVITNGFLFTEELVAELKQVKIESVSVSLDGPETVHDKFRQQGSFRQGLEAIKTLTKSGIPVSVISTLHSENVCCLDEMYEVLKHTNIFAWQLQACSPMGNVLNEELSVTIDFKAVMEFVEKHLHNSPMVIGIADNIGYYTEPEGYLRGSLNGRGQFCGCRAGLSAIGIDSIGNVRGCESMYDDCFIEGNLKEKSLQDIWYAPDAFAYNRKFTPTLLSGNCKDCQHGKYCAGGCRSYNYFTHKKLYESSACVHVAKKAL